MNYRLFHTEVWQFVTMLCMNEKTAE